MYERLANPEKPDRRQPNRPVYAFEFAVAVEVEVEVEVAVRVLVTPVLWCGTPPMPTQFRPELLYFLDIPQNCYIQITSSWDTPICFLIG